MNFGLKWGIHGRHSASDNFLPLWVSYAFQGISTFKTNLTN